MLCKYLLCSPVTIYSAQLRSAYIPMNKDNGTKRTTPTPGDVQRLKKLNSRQYAPENNINDDRTTTLFNNPPSLSYTCK
ncbi:hypothetical protein VTL71DRAFT_9621 [Oculimacula yallundae]|uniref:Uncharacterized protein n=1 Tax=Oculimacula yallundae TaxID=86028 RepID=A0ABR4BSZ9_9HELO